MMQNPAPVQNDGQDIVKIDMRNIIMRLSTTDELGPDLRSEVESAFSAASLCSTFLIDSSHSSVYSGVDMDTIKEIFRPLTGRTDILELIVGIICKEIDARSSILCQEQEIRTLRLVPVLLECQALCTPGKEWSDHIAIVVARCLVKLEDGCKRRFNMLVSWWRDNPDQFRRTISIFKGALMHKMPHGSIRLDLVFALVLMNEVNEKSGEMVPRNVFYINEMETMYFFYKPQYENYRLNCAFMPKTTHLFTILDFPFLMNALTKWNYLKEETVRQQRDFGITVNVNMETVQLPTRSRYAGLTPLLGIPPHYQHVAHQMGQATQSLIPSFEVRMKTILTTKRNHFKVKRNDIVASAFANVKQKWDEDDVWLQYLQVDFEGEYAIDIGGPSKEFFDLLFKELMNTEKLPIFKKVDGGNIWFNEEYKDLETLEMIGLLFYLMIYNRAIVTVPFHIQLYERLLTNMNTLSMDELMKCIDSQTSVSAMDSNTESELAVINNLFLAFERGFRKLSRGTPLLRIFKPEELRAIVLGGKFDWHEFENSTRYEPPYTKEHDVIKRFWKVFHSLDEDTKRSYLEFQTCAAHVPIEGFQSLQFTIRYLDTRKRFDADPSEIILVVMTCQGYISLDLPAYESEEIMKFWLLRAINSPRAFHRETPPNTVVAC